MKDQINTIREALTLSTDGPIIGRDDMVQKALTALTQLEAMAGEPYGTVTVVRNPGCVDMHWFYRWPDPPYLDNAAECHTVYTAAPVAQQYEAGDMASAAAQGFRDGVASVAQQHVHEADCGNIDWKAQYEHQKRRAERWIAKYEADIGPLEKAGPVAQQQTGENNGY